MLAEFLATADSYARPLVMRFPPRLATKLYSTVRNGFLAQFVTEKPSVYEPPAENARTLWGIRFRSGIMNAAGIFKNGEGVETCFRQGAGAYLAGTTTAHSRTGNIRNGIAKPFLPYPRSGAASNWLGLPNEGHAAVAKRLANAVRYEGFPLGASLMIAPESSGKTALEELAEGMRLYNKAGMDFLEINESCPNVAHGNTTVEAISERLEYVAQSILRKRSRNLPVIVKFSTDTALEDVPKLLDVLFTLGFDGVNFGNTSTRYAEHHTAIASQERPAFDYFTQTFGGGVSGTPLRASSLALVSLASEYCRQHPPQHEFHIIRTGGISTRADVEESWTVGAALCQWYTGYFEGFARHGHGVYKRMYEPSEVHNIQ